MFCTLGHAQVLVQGSTTVSAVKISSDVSKPAVHYRIRPLLSTMLLNDGSQGNLTGFNAFFGTVFLKNLDLNLSTTFQPSKADQQEFSRPMAPLRARTSTEPEVQVEMACG